MRRLRGAHSGQTATIVGLGPSVLALTASDFGPGPVITINHAILIVRRLDLPNVLYSMQKDGCRTHDRRMVNPVTRCICPSTRMPAPLLPEHVLLSRHESAYCHAGYPLRHVFDTSVFGMRWSRMSAPVAVRIAAWMGCTSVRMLGHDAYTCGDTRRALDSFPPGNAYARAGAEAEAMAERMGLRIAWT